MMDTVIKVTSGILITVILCLAVGKQQKDITLLILIVACSMTVVIGLRYLSPVLEFINRITEIGQLNGGFLGILMKAVGIGMLCEIVSNICTDAGNSALGKSLQFLSTAVILWLSIPIMEELLELIDSILGNL